MLTALYHAWSLVQLESMFVVLLGTAGKPREEDISLELTMDKATSGRMKYIPTVPRSRPRISLLQHSLCTSHVYRYWYQLRIDRESAATWSYISGHRQAVTTQADHAAEPRYH